MKVLVTGGLGFIGAYTAKVLLARGHEVVALDVHGDLSLLRATLAPADATKVPVVRADIGDLAELLHVCRGHAVEAIVHLAHLVGPGADKPGLSLDVNCRGSINVFETAALLDMERVTWASSIAVWGPPPTPDHIVRNDDLHDPRSLYGACKSFVERLGGLYREGRGVDCNAARLPVIYGPGRIRGVTAFASHMMEAAIAGEPYEVAFPDERHNFLFVEDAATCLVDLVEAPRTPTLAYNVSGASATNWDFAESVAAVAPKAAFRRGRGAPRDLAPSRYDASQLARDVGFRPRFSIEQATEVSLAWAAQKSSPL